MSPLSQQMNTVIANLHHSGILLPEAVREFRKRFIVRVLSECQWNQCKAARELGMHRNTLSRTLTELKLDVRQARKDWQLTHPHRSKPQQPSKPRVWPENPIETLLKKGMTPADVARTLGRSLTRVHQIQDRMAQRREQMVP